MASLKEQATGRAIVHIGSEKSWRGGEQQTLELMRGLAELDYRQALVARTASPLARVGHELALPVLEVRWDPFRWIATALQIKAFVEQQAAGVVAVHSSKAHTLALLAVQLGMQVPLVVHRRVYFHTSKGPQRLITRWKYRHPAVRRIISVSEAIRASLPVPRSSLQHAEHYPVIYSAVQLSAFPRREAAQPRLRPMLGLSEATPLVGAIAAITPDKAPLRFVNTAADAIEQGFAGHFVMMGDGPLLEAVQKRIRTRALTDRVHLLGFREDIPQLLPQLDLLLHAPVSEGLGSTILQAFAARVPVVASQVGGIPELIRHQRTGWLVPSGTPQALAQQLGAVLAHPAAQQPVVEAAYRFVQQFSYQHMAAATAKVYEGVMQEAVRRGPSG
jgi:glycosyltransferase involved in cell wall biosynthesis